MSPRGAAKALGHKGAGGGWGPYGLVVGTINPGTRLQIQREPEKVAKHEQTAQKYAAWQRDNTSGGHTESYSRSHRPVGSGDRGASLVLGGGERSTRTRPQRRHQPQPRRPARRLPWPPRCLACSKLKGKWLRPDGGYVIEVRNVEDGGTMDVAYFNPRPIKVSKAEASQDGATTKVFLELRDVNYPGSTYTLRYDPASDQLKGVYYRAAPPAARRSEVVFVEDEV